MTASSLPRSRRRVRRTGSLVAATALLAVTLVGCGEDDGSEDSAGDPAPSSQTSEPDDTGSSETPSEGSESSEAAPEAGELPEWSPEILTEGEAVTGLDFTDTPEPGPELEVAVVTEGDGAPVEAGQAIEVNYYGSLYQSDTPFDESYSRGQTVTFPIGVGQVIPGWDEGIPGVNIGSRIIMSIPADLGYGEAGSPPVIPPNSPLYFVVDIVNATDAAQ